jgi:hypothetical protein
MPLTKDQNQIPQYIYHIIIGTPVETAINDKSIRSGDP